MTLEGQLLQCRAAFIPVLMTTAVVNVLYLTASIFMMQVYDRVLGSQSVPTLIALSLIAIFVYLLQGFLDILRQRMISRAAEHIESNVAVELCRAFIETPVQQPATPRESLQPFRDMEALRSFSVGGGLIAVLDMPWTPLYLCLLFLLHPLLGWIGLAGALGLIAVAVLAELSVHAPAGATAAAASERNHWAESARRGAEAARAMGMYSAVLARWTRAHKAYLRSQRRATDRSSGLSSLSRTLRYALQSGMLGLAAYLAISGDISAGAIVTSTILAARAMAPVDLAIVHWRGFLAARHAWRQVSAWLATTKQVPSLHLPPPQNELRLESAFFGVPGRTTPVVFDVRLTLVAGSALGIVGPSASGKSTLAGAMVGVRPCVSGRVLLDGAAFDRWDNEILGRHIGYLPQDVQLFEGTIGENISRLRPDAASEAILAAAKLADLHKFILDLPKGYDTQIGPGGSYLSTGQRQRLGLARALFGDPFLVVLDEPNANLDTEGEQAVCEAVASVRARGGIAVVVTHRPSVLQVVDHVLVLRAGRVAAFGARDDMVKKAPTSIATLRAARREELDRQRNHHSEAAASAQAS